MPIRVLLVDDDPLVRSGLRFMFDSAADLEVAGETGDGDSAVRLADELRPDVVLMDLRMPGTDGITATARIRALPDPPAVIVLTTWDVDDAVLRSLDAGAAGFLLKTAAPVDIMQALRAVTEGDAVLSPRSTRQLLDHLRADAAAGQRRAAEQVLEELTEREREVCVGVGLGLTNAEVAKRLYIAETTVKAHLATIQTKLDVRNRVEIAVLAERAGLLYGR